MILSMKKIIKKLLFIMWILSFFLIPMFYLIPMGVMSNNMIYLPLTVFSFGLGIICISLHHMIETRKIDNIQELNNLENFFKICDYESEKLNEDKNNGNQN